MSSELFTLEQDDEIFFQHPHGRDLMLSDAPDEWWFFVDIEEELLRQFQDGSGWLEENEISIVPYFASARENSVRMTVLQYEMAVFFYMSLSSF